jgi:SIR2-like domain
MSSTTPHSASGSVSAHAAEAASLELERHCRNIAPDVLEGHFVPVLGSGVNLCERPSAFQWEKGSKYLPSTEELARHLARQSAYTPDRYRHRRGAAEDAPPDEKYEPVFDLIEVSQYVEVLKGSVDLYRKLHDVFVDEDYHPSIVHRFLARLAQVVSEPLLMLTTNYDFALENAFRAAGIPYDVVTYVTDYPRNQRGRFTHSRWEPGMPAESPPRVITSPNKYTAAGAERAAIVKIHGAAKRDGDYKQDNYVISEDDYIDYLMQPNTTLRLPVTIRERLSESPFLFLGYSLSDWNLRVLLRRIWEAQWLSARSWSVRLDADEMDEVFWQQQGVLTLRHPLREYILALRRACIDSFLRSFSAAKPEQRRAMLASSRPEALFYELAEGDRMGLVDDLPAEQLEAFLDELPQDRRDGLLAAAGPGA